MVAGVETAGLALAAFPIVISCLRSYIEGAQTVRRWHHYGRELNRYARKLEAEKVVYQNLTEDLFEGIVNSEEDLTTMLEDPTSPLWQKPEYRAGLQTLLHPSYDNYIAWAEDLVQTLELMKRKLGIDSSGGVSSSPIVQYPSAFARHLVNERLSSSNSIQGVRSLEGYLTYRR